MHFLSDQSYEVGTLVLLLPLHLVPLHSSGSSLLMTICISFRSVLNTKIMLLCILLITPTITDAKPLTSNSAVANRDTDTIKQQINRVGSLSGSTELKHLDKTAHTLHRLAQVVQGKAKDSERINTIPRVKRWNAKELVMSLLSRHRKNSSPPVQGTSTVALYDPFGGGVWGRKKRSDPDFSDFDYENDDL